MPAAVATAGAVEERDLALRARLAFASFLMLFVELALIRWTAANDVHLAYMTNFVLLASFLGIGIGFLNAGRGRTLLPLAPVALALLVGFVMAFPVSLQIVNGTYQLQGASGLPLMPKWVSLAIVFALAAAVMAAIGDGVARLFVQFRPLEAYRLDILGSIAGIVAFSALSFLDAPPIVWGVVAALGLLLLTGRRTRWWQVAGAVAVIVVLAVESASATEHWSPYYKITAVQPPKTHGVLVVSANNIPHQTAYPVPMLHWLERFYFFPYRHVDRHKLDQVLIVGAGTGNDVAVALREGAKHVDAVEIDPVLQRLGRTYRIDGAYRNPRVSVHINDGRAFLQQTSKRYDLVLFALPDSLTLLPGQSNLRLENYLFTVEAMRTVRAHLKPGGTFAMYNYYEKFLLDRYAGTLASVFGRPPCVEVGDRFLNRRQAVLTIGANGTTPNCRTLWHGPPVTDPPTDDHPFPYLQTRSIPSFYLWTLAVILAVSVVLVRAVGGPLRRVGRYADLAFMGGAFLLLETKNIVQFALLFGTTWLVNSLVFAGVLLSVFAAVEVARLVRLPRPWVLYAALGVALAVAWVVPQESLLALSPVPRFLAATGDAFAPIFLANLVFAQRFRDTAATATAFAANLLGAMIGGVLEYLALITGYRFLLVLVAALYALAFLTARVLLPRTAAAG